MSSLRKSPKRRKRTWGEKEALRLKKLREEFGYSSVDPDEPSFSEGMPRFALRCAYKDAKQTVSQARRKFSPATVAKRTASTARLTFDQKNELQIWLIWLNDRPDVTRDPSQSFILQWALSHDGPDEWSGDETGEWRRKVENAHPAHQAHGQAKISSKAASAGFSNSDVGSPFKAKVGQPPARDTDVLNGSTVVDDREDVSSLSSAPHQSVASWRPALPQRAFAKGEIRANAFFGALRDKPDDALREAAIVLSADPEALSKALSRSNDVAQCIEAVSKHFGLPLTGSKP